MLYFSSCIYTLSYFLNSATIHTDIKISHYVQCAYVVEVERTSKYRTLNTSNIDTPNFEHFEHDAQILRPNFEQARPNIEHLSKIKNTDNSANKND